MPHRVSQSSTQHVRLKLVAYIVFFHPGIAEFQISRWFWRAGVVSSRLAGTLSCERACGLGFSQFLVDCIIFDFCNLEVSFGVVFTGRGESCEGNASDLGRCRLCEPLLTLGNMFELCVAMCMMVFAWN